MQTHLLIPNPHPQLLEYDRETAAFQDIITEEEILFLPRWRTSFGKLCRIYCMPTPTPISMLYCSFAVTRTVKTTLNPHSTWTRGVHPGAIAFSCPTTHGTSSTGWAPPYVTLTSSPRYLSVVSSTELMNNVCRIDTKPPMRTLGIILTARHVTGSKTTFLFIFNWI